MNNFDSSKGEISIALYVKEVNDRFGKNGDILESIVKNANDLAPKIRDALIEVEVNLAEMIQSALMSRENLRKVDEESSRSTTPVAVDRNTHQISPEILGWSIAILASAWTEWVFASKSNEYSKYQTDPAYKNDKDRQAADVNVKLALPYVNCSIMDAIGKAREIGSCNQTNYEPNPKIDPAYISLRKAC
jgi:hypothetical protein